MLSIKTKLFYSPAHKKQIELINFLEGENTYSAIVATMQFLSCCHRKHLSILFCVSLSLFRGRNKTKCNALKSNSLTILFMVCNKTFKERRGTSYITLILNSTTLKTQQHELQIFYSFYCCFPACGVVIVTQRYLSV